MYTEDAISKTTIIVIAASIILIVAAAVVILFTTSTPDKVPHMNATVEAAGNVIYFYHDGGDPFPRDRLLIRVNGEDISPDSYSLLHSQEWPWSAGKTVKVQYNGKGNPETVQVIYKSGSKQTVVFSQQMQTQPFIPIATVITLPPTIPAPVVTTVPVEVIATHAPSGEFTPVQPVIVPETPPAGSLIPAPPLAAFTAQPVSGPTPLIVHFTDQSGGIPVSWNWNFGDGGTSVVQNPVHTYQAPGIYPVSLVVANSFGTDKKTKEGYISTGVFPVSAFNGAPRSGDSPLEVHFIDLSTGNPVVWLWDFGDGSTSTLQNPTHTYGKGGTYQVSLTVANAYGGNNRIQSGYITAGTAPLHDVYLLGSAYGYLEPDGYIAFQVTDVQSWIKIAGKIYRFIPGDNVQLIIGDPQSGFIDASGNSITAFNFNLVRMYVNGALTAEGIVPEIGVSGYKDYRSSTTLIVPAGDSGATLFADGSKIVPGPGQKIIIRNFKPDANGKMSFSKKLFEVIYRGGAESYQVT
jgi:PKD repeat protein